MRVPERLPLKHVTLMMTMMVTTGLAKYLVLFQVLYTYKLI